MLDRVPEQGERRARRAVAAPERAPTVRRWAAAAGFTEFEVLPIDNPFWRFYRMAG